MRVRTGCDLASCARIERALKKHGELFSARFLTEAEQAYCAGRTERIAGRFAAKEAVCKALGTGFWQEGVKLGEIEILPDELGAPTARLSGNALERYRALHGVSLAVSVSHDKGCALGFAVLLAESEADDAAAAGTREAAPPLQD